MKTILSKSATPDSMWATATKKNNKNNMQSSHWITENFKSLVIVFCLIIMSGQAIFVQKAHAQENADTLALLIWIEDALGQKDSVFVYAKDGATEGLDIELGEINLYGTPMKDPEIRLIQRTDTNIVIDTTFLKGSFWLSGFYNEYNEPDLGLVASGTGWLRSYPENVDFKKNYTCRYEWCDSNANFHRIFVLNINTTNYPIILHSEIISTSNYNNISYYYDIPPVLAIYFHNKTDGKMDITKGCDVVKLNDSGTDKSIIYNTCIYDNLEDVSIFLKFEPIISIKEINHKMLHPNPAKNLVVLEDCNIGDSYQIINTTGLILKTDIVDNEDCVINIADLPASTYFIIVNNIFYKLIIER